MSEKPDYSTFQGIRTNTIEDFLTIAIPNSLTNHWLASDEVRIGDRSMPEHVHMAGEI